MQGQEEGMQYRRFGRTGLHISVLTFGAMRIPFGELAPEERARAEENAFLTMKRALEVGVNHFETARGYGNSEHLIGTWLPHLPVKREEIVITTKIAPTQSADEMRRTIEESCQRMGISTIDNLDIHGINTRELLELSVRKGGCLDGIRQAMKEGVVRHLGFSTHAPLEVIMDTMRTGEFESVNLHYYYFNQRNYPAIRLAEELDMGVLIISPTDKGGQLHNAPDKLRRVTAPCTPIEINQRFLLSDPAVTTLTVGAGKPEEWDAHLRMADRVEPLTAEEQTILQRLDETMKHELGDTYCSYCFECLPCPEDIHIPEVLRLRNMAKAFDMVDFGKFRYNLFGNGGHWFPGVQADACTDCGDCLPRCPLKLNIPALLRETHEMLTGEPVKRLWR